MTEHQRPELTQRQKLLRRGIPLLASVALLTGAGIASQIHPEGHDNNAVVELFDNDIHFSQEMNTITTQGETLWQIAGMIEGSENLHEITDAVSYIKSMPENANIYDENGKIPYGTQIYYPTRIDVY